MTEPKPPRTWLHYVLNDTCRAARLNSPVVGEERKADLTVEMVNGRETFAAVPHDAGKQRDGSYHHLHECGRKR